MKTVQIFIRSLNEGEYLRRGNCFEEELLKEFKWYEKNNFINNEWYIKLNEHLIKNKGIEHDQDILNSIFLEKIFIDYDFAEKLKLFDVIDSNCFNSNDELGDAILELCDSSSLHFIVAMKHFTGKDSIMIEFNVCYCERLYECHQATITQKFTL